MMWRRLDGIIRITDRVSVQPMCPSRPEGTRCTPQSARASVGRRRPCARPGAWMDLTGVSVEADSAVTCRLRGLFARCTRVKRQACRAVRRAPCPGSPTSAHTRSRRTAQAGTIVRPEPPPVHFIWGFGPTPHRPRGPEASSRGRGPRSRAGAGACCSCGAWRSGDGACHAGGARGAGAARSAARRRRRRAAQAAGGGGGNGSEQRAVEFEVPHWF